MKQNHHFVVTQQNFQWLPPTLREEEDDAGCRRNAKRIQTSAKENLPEQDENIHPFLTEYRFNTRTARHLHCEICGVCPLYVPRSNPDGFAVTIYCMDDYPPGGGGALSAKVEEFDGTNWEDFIGKSSIVGKTEGGGKRPA